MDSIVVGEFSEWEPVAPVGLSVVNEDPEVFLDLLVNSSCLSVGLRVGMRVEAFGVMSNIWYSSFMNLETNCGPLSEITVVGILWRA